MKFPQQENLHVKLHAEERPAQNSDLEELGEYELSRADLLRATEVIEKIKLIRTQRLFIFKKKVPELNHLFGRMSSFFFPRRSLFQKEKIHRKALRITQRKKAQIAIKSQKSAPVDEGAPLKPSLQLDSFAGDRNLFELESDKEEGLESDKEEGLESDKEEGLESEKAKGLEPSISKCYICKKQYTDIDEFYHSHCPPCAEFSMRKRQQTADLRGLTALVTGARIKIGFQIALRLLRGGAIVYGTTRFTTDALLRFEREADYECWGRRLFLIHCDFCSAPQVEALAQQLRGSLNGLDILINNAAQTIVRPKEFYSFELLNQHKSVLMPAQAIQLQGDCSLPSINSVNSVNSVNGQGALAQQQASAIDLSRTDEFGQPLDLRIKNTWKEKIEEVSLPDCLSTQIINSVVPFHLIGCLKGLMAGSEPSWVINVSSMEGVFQKKWKSHCHPHTNMAKASLNMITRTCAKEFSKQLIYMNSVDTGWVTEENPHPIAEMKQEKGFMAPLDCVEGAMRVLDPIFQGINQKKFPFGQFLKDYHPSSF